MPNVAILPNSPATLIPIPVNSSSSTIAAIAALQNQFIKVYKLLLVVGGVTDITFQDGSTPQSGPMPLDANGSIVLDIHGSPWYYASPGNALTIVNSGGVQVSGTLYYTVSST